MKIELKFVGKIRLNQLVWTLAALEPLQSLVAAFPFAIITIEWVGILEQDSIALSLLGIFELLELIIDLPWLLPLLGFVEEQIVFDPLRRLLDVLVQVFAHVAVPVHYLVDFTRLSRLYGVVVRCSLTGDLFVAVVVRQRHWFRSSG